jgi:predicted metal-dependent peptidase
MDDDALIARLSASAFRLRGRSPFFATLALFADPVLDDAVPSAGTDGRRILWNRAFLAALTPAQVDGVLLHEVLHAALLHLPRRGARDPLVWNIAADIVVNGMIDAVAQERPGTLVLPGGAVRKPELADLSVEEVYEALTQGAVAIPLPDTARDLLDTDDGPGSDGAALEAHWRAAQAQASALVRALGQGERPAFLTRELAMLDPAALDWRAHLWRFLVRTPTDFAGFDRRLIHRGFYLETLEGESLRVFLGVDTSGSVGPASLTRFLSEVGGILRAYPHVVCDLFYVDVHADGPHRLTGGFEIEALPRPTGGGGTDFRPFFDAVATIRHQEDTGESVCVYLTDGFGTFPAVAPDLPVLWVVPAGGLALERFPFGEATRLLMQGSSSVS